MNQQESDAKINRIADYLQTRTEEEYPAPFQEALEEATQAVIDCLESEKEVEDQ